MKKDIRIVGGGTSLTTLLTVLFVALKLLGIISWSWWWVLSPLWIGLAFPLVVLLFEIVILIASKD